MPGQLVRQAALVDRARWPARYLSPSEVACQHCHELYVHRPTFAAFDRARADIGSATDVNSGHRCALHNAAVGGAPLSCHKRIALDVSTRGKDRLRVLGALERAGFRGFGYYLTFVHVDLGRRRRWFGGSRARELWSPLLASRGDA